MSQPTTPPRSTSSSLTPINRPPPNILRGRWARASAASSSWTTSSQGRAGRPACDDPNVQGVQRLHEVIAKEPRVIATTLQVVGVKGYDGLTFAVVTKPCVENPGRDKKVGRLEAAQPSGRRSRRGGISFPLAPRTHAGGERAGEEGFSSFQSSAPWPFPFGPPLPFPLLLPASGRGRSLIAHHDLAILRAVKLRESPAKLEDSFGL